MTVMYKGLIKRAMDLCFAIIIIPFVILAIAILAPFIYAEDHGSILYVAERLGKDGRRFRMIKLRSMQMNAPDIRNEDGSTFNASDDGRVTGIGRLLRKTSLDEVPQVFNVLRGDMSFVGPRPNLMTMPFERLSAPEKKRVRVRPGITGYNQAYFRNAASAKQKYENDCYYVDNVSFMLDTKIMLRTLMTVLRRENINSDETPSHGIGGPNKTHETNV